MLTLFDYLPSQNAYKIRLLLSHLGRDVETQIISIFEGEGQSAWFREINPTGAVPAIRLDDGRVLAESNAILTFLAEGTPYLPADAFGRAKVMQWLSFEGNYVEPAIGTLRHWIMTGKAARRAPVLVESRRAASMKALAILDRELAERAFITGDAYTIADISLFAYVSRADEAELPLDTLANIVAWLDRVRAQPGFLATTYPYAIDPHASAELP